MLLPFCPAIWALAATASHGQNAVQFKATVRAGVGYARPIGHNLYFAIDQVDGGDWDFQIKPARLGRESFKDCLQDPFLHGPNSEDLLPWRFAAGAGKDWAEHIPTKKTFDFVTSAADQRYECAETNAEYSSFQQSQAKGDDPDYTGLPGYKPRHVGTQRL